MVVIAGIALSAVERLALYRMLKTTGPEQALYTLRLYVGLDTRADALLVGCLTGLCAAWGYLPTRSDLRMRIAAAVAIFGIGYLSLYRCLDHSQFYHGLFTVAALMTATVIVRLLTAKGRPPLARLLELPPLVAAGKLSYGLYLYHMPVIHWLGVGGLGWTGPACPAAGLTLVISLLSYFFVERPFVRLKSRFEHRMLDRNISGSIRNAGEVGGMNVSSTSRIRRWFWPERPIQPAQAEGPSTFDE